MIQNTKELEATLTRIRYFQKQVEKLRKVETNPQNYRLSAGGFLAEIDRMNLELAGIYQRIRRHITASSQQSPSRDETLIPKESSANYPSADFVQRLTCC